MEDLKITLAAARVNAGLTQDDVAKTMHVSKTTIVNWENGNTELSASALMALSDLYKWPIKNIFLPTKSPKRGQ